MNRFNFLLPFLFFLLLISQVLSQFSTAQISELINISNDCGFQWTTPLQCKSTSIATNLKNSIQCDGDGNIIRIDLEPAISCGLPNHFDLFPNLKILTLKDVNVSKVPITIYQHPILEQLTFDSTKYSFVITTDNGSNDWSKMKNLKLLHISFGLGIMPIFPNTISTFYYASNSKTSSTINRLPIEIFTPSLTTLYLQFLNPPADAGIAESKIFQNATSLTSFLLFAPSYAINFNIFFKPPPSLKILQLFLLNLGANKTMPRIGEVSWGSLQTLVLNVLDIQGSFDPNFFYLPNLKILYMEQNSGLTGMIPSDFGLRSSLLQLFISQTGFSGSLPENLLFNGLAQLDVTGTFITNAYIPTAFLCLPKSVFSAGGNINYMILIDPTVFSPNSRAPCKPVINSITSPIGSLDYSIEVKGGMLSTFSQYFTVTMSNINTQASLNCQQKSFGTVLTCSNPFIYGNGTLSLTINNDETPLPTTTIPFQYRSPIITSVSPVSTNGGTATIYGQNFWISSPNVDSYNYVVLLNDAGNQITQCTNIKVINAYQTLTCTLPAGITGGTLAVSVSGQDNKKQAYAFQYNGPIIKSTTTSLIPTKAASTITLLGQDFWNQTSLVSVKVQGLDCPVQSVAHTMLTCTFPETAFILPSGILDVTILVNGQGYTENNLITMMDPSFCPNNCGVNGVCNIMIGQCLCNIGFSGSDCGSLTTLESNLEWGSNNASIKLIPIETIKSVVDSSSSSSSSSVQSSMMIYLVSIIENQNDETIIDKWETTTTTNNQTTYTWTGSKGQTITATIRNNKQSSSDSFITFPMNSITYRVDYKSANGETIDNPQFKFEFNASPEECQSLPFTFANPTGSSVDTRYFSLHTYHSEYFGRFPKIATINGGQGSITTNSVGSSGLYTKMITKVNSYSVNSATFEIDLTILSNAISREPLLTGCILNNGNGGSSGKDNWKIGVGVGVGIGGAALICSAFFIVRQRIKLKKTQNLLDKKLKEINNNL